MTSIPEIRHVTRVRDDLLRAELRLGNEIGAIERRLAREKKVQGPSVTQMPGDQSFLSAPALHNAKAYLHDQRTKRQKIGPKQYLPSPETTVKKLVRQLPVWPWVAGVRGFGEIGVAQIISYAGDLNRYKTKGKLYVMLSVGMVDGQPQRRVANNPALAKRLRYSPQRRGTMMQLADSLLKGQQGGPYRQKHERYKLREIEKTKAAGLKIAATAKIKKMPPAKRREYRSEGHIYASARLRMFKDLLRDFLKAWKAAAS